MQTCWRCGIKFEGTGDVCADCTEQLPAPHWPVLADYVEDVWDARWALVGPYYQEGKLDPEIAELLGINTGTVRDTRRHFNKPAQKRVGMHSWKDPEAQAEHAANMVRYRKTSKRGKTVDNFDGSGPRRG